MATRRGFLKFLGSLIAVPLLPPLKVKKENKDEKKIVLVEVFIAGFQYYDGMQPPIAKTLRRGDKLLLRPEPNNPYDDNAIEITTLQGNKLGYIPRYLNEIPTRIVAQGIDVGVKIKKIDLKAPTWERVLIELYQVL